MPPAHITERRERVRRRRRRTIGFVRFTLFLGLMAAATLALVGIGTAGDGTAQHRPATAAETPPPAPAGTTEAAAPARTATAARTADAPSSAVAPRPVVASASVPRADDTVVAARAEAQAVAAAHATPATATPATTPAAGTRLPLTGPPSTEALALAASLIGLLGMALQIATQPTRRRRPSGA